MSPSSTERSGRRCPVCGRAPEEKYRPFCSKRCADIDLGRWFRGGYAIPAEEQEPPEDDSQNEDPH